MAHVLMPHLGVSVTEGTLSSWLKQVGETVEVGEPICEVSTDKVDTEIESTVAGVLTQQLHAVDDVVQVGEALAAIASHDEIESEPEPSIVPDPTSFGAGSEPEPPEALESRTPDTPVPDGALVLMPRLGVSVTEGTVSSWLKQVGETVEVGEPICEVSTDKVDTEIESTVAGMLAEQRYAEGEVVQVGEPLAVVTRDGSPAPAVGTSPAAVPDSPPVPATLRPHRFDHEAEVRRVLDGLERSGRSPASPGARRLAADLGVDLATVRGTGGAGHVTRRDVLEWARRPQPVAAQRDDVAPAAASLPKPGPAGLPAGYEDVPYDEVATSRIRRVTAEHMTRSRRTAAHMTTEVDVDLGRLTEVRARLNARRASVGEGKLSFLPFVARATCAALLEHRDLNATFETERLLRWNEVNLGIAVDTPRGLMVPVLRAAHRMTVETLAEGITDVAGRLRDGKPEPDDFRAGTFTISNPGSVGAVSAPAIINQPQVAILGMPTIQRKPWVVVLPDGQETIAIRPILRLALTFDHRAVDGADATRCLVDICRRLEAWDADDYR